MTQIDSATIAVPQTHADNQTTSFEYINLSVQNASCLTLPDEQEKKIELILGTFEPVCPVTAFLKNALELEDEGLAYDSEFLKSNQNDGDICWVIRRISEDMGDRRDDAGDINIALIDAERARAELGLVYDQFDLISSWLSLTKAKQENKSPASVAGGAH